ncbi:hypothetical protein [Curtobacterium sp. MCSS17_015]|uniref:hypothetical protein n=1 Tax=Curtobacterium sp. MCSS17_015 TaxID=2175666 RepID=UPI000DA8E452|nr:hypothetical protein [Curtobacterium sp. MCSS17_015]WIB25440.1 hypothetical protein DEJ18_10260 [Curtobacterium sp. MCSS17_015]
MGDHEQKTGGRLRELTAMLGARAKKAYSAGVAGAALAIGGISVAGFWADGKVDTEKVAAAAGSIVVGFVAGFLAAFLPRNAVAPPPGPQSAQPGPPTTDYRDEQAP